MSAVSEEMHILAVDSVKSAIEVNEHAQILGHVVGRYLKCVARNILCFALSWRFQLVGQVTCVYAAGTTNKTLGAKHNGESHFGD
jgi:hypothetical protein